MWRIPFLLLLGLIAGCGQLQVQSDGGRPGVPGVYGGHVITTDGYRLPLHRWEPEVVARGVVLGLHGFGDHGGSFAALAGPLNEAGYEVYAYDQRGFGATERPGIWSTSERLSGDVAVMTELLRERHGELPLYLIGKSMGAAVALTALARVDAPEVDGLVLIAPAVWARQTMPWYQRLGLWMLLRVAPGLQLSGDAAHDLGIRPTDDPEVMRALSLDPLTLKRSRVDAVHGLTELMGEALEASARLRGPTLILYGDNDQVIPARPLCEMLIRLPPARETGWRLVLYPNGYHMLTRYTGAARTYGDVAAWLSDHSAPLPSGDELDRARALDALCEHGAAQASLNE
ncbi:MAG TPA: lysophospholipase [Thioalkalivibrio sp.]|nr:lysophospholipase [Thioalkalivibrio sp.]